MNEFELKYDDYVEKVEINEDEKDNYEVVAIYDKLDDYCKILNEKPRTVNVGFSLKNGYFTYGKSGDNSDIMRMGSDIEKAFLRIIIYNIELPKLNRAFSMVKDIEREPQVWEKLSNEDKQMISSVTYDLPKFKSDFERVYPGVEFKNIMYYPTYILRRLRRYYDGSPIGYLLFDDVNNKVKYIGKVPFYVVEFFENYLKNATGIEWNFNGIDFVPVRDNNVKSDTGMIRKRVSEEN